jgi:hypothetical protein
LSDAPGWYCYRPVPALAEWDGTAWTGSTHGATAAPELDGPPRPFAFLRQSWVWWIIAGQALVIPPAVASGVTGDAIWSWLSAPGYLAFLIGTVQVMVRYLPVGRLPRLRGLTTIGVVGGTIGFALAYGLETWIEHRYGIATTLWSTGPIEEGAKLLVPFALLVFGSSRFADPLAGLYLVLVSGGTTGALEGIEWESRTHHVWLHLQLALVRPAAEIPHVFVTGFAGAVIWLAAWRRGRAVTLAGTVAFLIAVGLHSLHDGFITLFGVSPQPTPASIAQTAGQAVAKGLAGGFSALGIGIAAFVLGRHGARELSPPGSVAAAPPPWRPQIKTWGAVDPVRWVPSPPVGYPAPRDYAHDARGVPVGAPSTAEPGVRPPPSPPPRPVPTAGAASVATPPPPVPGSWPPGWYPVAGDPSRAAWWSGAAWSTALRWDGAAWRQD